MFDGLLDLPLWGALAAALVTTHITIAGVTIYLHRCQAHRALSLHPGVSHFFRLWLWMTTAMSTREWVAVHRKHHAFADQTGDPHSPRVEGIRKVLWQGAELYKQETTNAATLGKYGRGTPEDWLERNLYTRFPNVGLGLTLIAYLLLFGVAGVAVWGIQMIWIPFWAAGVINGVGHYWGYRNYETADAATNIVPWGILIGGEELHNNHHAYPASARFSSKWWEFDIGWLYIWLLARVRLAQIKRLAPRPFIVPGKQLADMDTLRAVVFGRLHVTAHYARAVIVPVLRDELAGADAGWRRALKRARKTLVRNDRLIDANARARLERVLDHSARLRTVHQYRQQLQEVWERTATSHEQLLQRLQEWCRQAEATRIDALQQFARSLRAYGVQPA